MWYIEHKVKNIFLKTKDNHKLQQFGSISLSLSSSHVHVAVRRHCFCTNDRTKTRTECGQTWPIYVLSLWLWFSLMGRVDCSATIWLYSIWVNVLSNNIQNRLLLPVQLSLLLSFSCFDFSVYLISRSASGSTTFIFIIICITIPHSFTAPFLPPLSFCPPPLSPSPPCLDLLVCSVYFSLSVGVRFGTSGISSSLLSFNPAVLPEGIRRKAPGS